MGIRDQKCQRARDVHGSDAVKYINLCLIILAFGLTNIASAQEVPQSQVAQCTVSTGDGMRQY